MSRFLYLISILLLTSCYGEEPRITFLPPISIERTPQTPIDHGFPLPIKVDPISIPPSYSIPDSIQPESVIVSPNQDIQIETELPINYDQGSEPTVPQQESEEITETTTQSTSEGVTPIEPTLFPDIIEGGDVQLKFIVVPSTPVYKNQTMSSFPVVELQNKTGGRMVSKYVELYISSYFDKNCMIPVPGETEQAVVSKDGLGEFPYYFFINSGFFYLRVKDLDGTLSSCSSVIEVIDESNSSQYPNVQEIIPEGIIPTL